MGIDDMNSEQSTAILKKSPLYPFRLQPIYKDYLWGGSRIRESLHRDIEPGRTVAESWDVSDHAGGVSIIENGPLAGVSIHDLVAARPEGVFGTESKLFDRFSRFPLMFKYIDAKKMTSVQVHPDEENAKNQGFHDTGKAEAWIVLEADPGSVIYAGFKKPTNRNEVEAALKAGTIESLLNRVEPKPGDCYMIPPGTIHSAGNGVFLAEVQQTSDMSFRLFDWNQTDESGKERQLHTEQSLRCINYDFGPVIAQVPHPTEYKNCERLVISEFFTLNRWVCNEMFSWTSDNRCHIWSVLQGNVTAIFHLGRRIMPEDMSGRQSDPIAMECLKRGDTLLVPNSCRSIQWTVDGTESVVLVDLVSS